LVGSFFFLIFVLVDGRTTVGRVDSNLRLFFFIANVKILK